MAKREMPHLDDAQNKKGVASGSGTGNIPDNVDPSRVHVHQAITEGKVVEKSKLQKAASIFFEEDMDSIKDSIVDDYIKPRAKDFLRDSIRKVKEYLVENITAAAEIFFFGKTDKANRKGTYNGQKVNYVSYYGNDGGYSYYGNNRNANTARDPVTSIRRVSIPSFGKAEAVLTELIAIARKYNAATTADYYQLVGVTPSKEDFNFGWFDFVGVQVIYDSSSGGYILTLPKPVPLD